MKACLICHVWLRFSSHMITVNMYVCLYPREMMTLNRMMLRRGWNTVHSCFAGISRVLPSCISNFSGFTYLSFAEAVRPLQGFLRWNCNQSRIDFRLAYAKTVSPWSSFSWDFYSYSRLGFQGKLPAFLSGILRFPRPFFIRVISSNQKEKLSCRI